MVDKIIKALGKLTAKEKQLVRELLIKIPKQDFKGLNLKKLEGRDDIFRLRKGKIRIIFRREKNQKIHLLAIERRSEKTYRKF